MSVGGVQARGGCRELHAGVICRHFTHLQLHPLQAAYTFLSSIYLQGLLKAAVY